MCPVAQWRLLTKKRVGVFLILFLLVAAFLLAPFWLPLVGAFLVVNDTLERADAIVVLSGAVVWRIPKGVALHKEGYADKILVTGGYANDYFLHLMGERMTEAEMTGRLVERMGVPSSAVVVLKGGRGTWEEAEYVRQYVRDEHIRKIILVTSHSHSRRARWVFRKVLHPEGVKVMVVEADNGRYTAANWWRTESGLVTVFTEYVKLFYYLANYAFREPSTVKPLTHPVPAD
ncbi:MAG: YdcF family protein [Candidatus Methylomirabilales bacterium]